MWVRFAIFLVAAAASVHPVGVSAMSNQQHGHCHVVAAEKLPPAAGGARALCAAVERAVEEHAPQVGYSAEIKVLSRSRLSALLVVNGRALPEQQFGVTDRDLSQGSIQRFAAALALEVAKAAKG